MKNRPVEAELFHADRETGGQRDWWPERLADRETGGQRDWWTERLADRETGGQREWRTERLAEERHDAPNRHFSQFGKSN